MNIFKKAGKLIKGAGKVLTGAGRVITNPYGTLADVLDPDKIDKVLGVKDVFGGIEDLYKNPVGEIKQAFSKEKPNETVTMAAPPIKSNLTGYAPTFSGYMTLEEALEKKKEEEKKNNYLFGKL